MSFIMSCNTLLLYTVSPIKDVYYYYIVQSILSLQSTKAVLSISNLKFIFLWDATFE